MPYHGVFAADTLLYAVTLTLDLWSWTTPPRRSYCDFNIWPNDLEHVMSCVTYCARLWDNFHQISSATRYPCLNYSVFYADTLCQAVLLTFDPLTLKVRGTSGFTWSKSLWNVSEIEQSPAELLIILRIFAHVMSRCDLDRWPLYLELLQRFGCPAFKLCTKFKRNRIIHSWIIDDLARFRRAMIGVGHFCPTVLRVAWIQLHPTWRGHRAIFHTEKFCFSVRIYCCIFKRGRLKVEWCWKRRQISHFLTPPLWKLGEGGRDLYINCWSFTYGRTSGIHLMAIDCTAAERGRLI